MLNICYALFCILLFSSVVICTFYISTVHLDIIRVLFMNMLNILIHNILHNNGFPIPNHTHNHRPKLNTIPTPPPEPPHQPPAKKWCTFTYIGKEATKITKLFKDTNLQIAYRTNNTIQKHLTQKNHHSGQVHTIWNLQTNMQRLP